MLRRIKRFLGFSSRGAYFPNNEVAPADGSLISTSSRKSTKSEKKSAKKEKKKSPLIEKESYTSSYVHPSTPPTDIVLGGEESVACSVTELDRQTVITDSLPYRDPSDKVFIESSTLVAFPLASSTRSLAGSLSTKSRMEMVASDALITGASSVESVYSTDINQESFQGKLSDVKSRELPVDCDLPKPLSPPQSSPTASSNASSLCVNLPTITAQHEEEEIANGREEADAMKKLNAELDGLLKTSAPPFQVSCARLPPMLTKELPPHEEEQSLLSHEEFDDSKNNSVARILNESHEATTRSPENKHLRSYGY